MEFTSVNKIYQESFKKNWERPAISNYQGVTLKYGDVARRIAKLHIMFEECGLQKGDKVALCSRNQANWAVAFLSTMTYGAVPVPLPHVWWCPLPCMGDRMAGGSAAGPARLPWPDHSPATALAPCHPWLGPG